MPTFTTPKPIAATVEVAGAQVQVTASDRTDTVVDVRPLDPSRRKDVKVAENTKVELIDGQLSVKMKTAGDKKGSVAISVDLPTGSRLAVYLAHSVVRSGGTLGDCELHMASGQVQLDSTDTLKASIASGDVEIGHIAGRTDIDGAAFTMRIAEVEGTVALLNSGGRAWIGRAAADVGLRSSSCDFDIDRVDGSITATTSSGAIRIGRMSNGRANLTNGSGDIEVGIAEGAAASIDVNSERGAVHNFVASPGEPGPTDAKVSVHARTRHGDVTVQRAKS
ncbi:DUF4097 family beta strand repeat-containing protein [Phytoactinopolyspora limicola]|uniref:DUF4097 family beta strand repeat-containing protein n=1 Tax=Phytoactinopolyspora limicola TaxID=2715536 RepID=UPI00140B9CA5|nr:DUF4097 family beta strand repeat-containing protein [Phytoactinopolyspora limicola]